ncbi:hypothetical protein C0993_007959 [Termitomyces sp. T159_Od127]|nr:hypothetical protein C0993_007959 [Termitomyces sp. T159_Od127]
MKAHELSVYLKEKWNSMTKKEKIAFTDSLLKEFKEHRNSMFHGEQNVILESFSDARQSLLMIQKYISALHSRMGTEVLLIASQGLADDFLHPYAMWTSDCAFNFPFHQFRLTLAELTGWFEAYCLSGIEGMVNKFTSTTIELRSKLKDIINGELKSIIDKVRMVYVRFDEKITMPYGVVIKHWPIDQFHSPSVLTCAEVNVFLGAWTSKTSYFHKLEQEEWEKWKNDYHWTHHYGPSL